MPRLLGDMGCPDEGCEDIEVSPDGKWALWSAKKKLWLASVDGKQQAKELASVRGRRLSRNGRPMANISRSSASGTVIALSLFTTSMATPSATWHPAWTKIPCRAGRLMASGLFLCAPLEMSKAAADSGAPAALVAVDCGFRTGTGRLLWRSGEKPEDSLPELSENGSLNFAADGR